MAETTPRQETQRLDARRNREAVIEAAISLLAERPSASMQDVAEASRVGRTTVYRHFPTREDLLRALFDRVIEEAQEMTVALVSDEPPALELIRSLGPEMIRIGERFRFLESHRELRDQVLDEAANDDGTPLHLYMAAAQRRGELRDDMPVRWMLAMTQGVALAAMDEVIAGRTEPADAGELVADTLVSAFAPR